MIRKWGTYGEGRVFYSTYKEQGKVYYRVSLESPDKGFLGYSTNLKEAIIQAMEKIAEYHIAEARKKIYFRCEKNRWIKR